MLIRMAWRNLLRNRRRSLLASTAIGIGLAALIFTDGLMAGMLDSMIRTATDTFMGHGQISAVGYRQSREVGQTLVGLRETVRRLEENPSVAAWTPRTEAFAMLASPSGSEAVLLIGVDPEREAVISRLEDAVTAGAFLKEGDRRILIGMGLADLLDVSMGDRLVVTVAEEGTGALAQEMLRVGGLLQFGIREMDRRMAFMDLSLSEKLLGLDGGIHQIAVKLTRLELDRDAFWESLAVEGNEALGWRSLVPQLDTIVQMSDFSAWIVGAILFAVVALVIINTLFMSLYERMFEFGVLRALGTRPWRMARMILAEAAALAVLSIGVGALLGWCATYGYSGIGIDYSGVEVAGVMLQERIYPVVNPAAFIIYPFWLFVFTQLAALYPAIFAARLTPAEAMKHGD